jgi:hypothetical protein
MEKGDDDQARKECEEVSQWSKVVGPQSGKGRKRGIMDMEKDRKESGLFRATVRLVWPRFHLARPIPIFPVGISHAAYLCRLDL